MSDNLNELTTVENYINYYYEQFKESVESRGMQISKVGFIGYFLNILGSTQFDVKQYFDMLFREAFLATSDENENLELHGRIYGYNTLTSKPASLIGTIKINLDNLPTSFNDEERRIDISDLVFDISGIKYTLVSKYTIIGNNCQVQTSLNEMMYVPYNVSKGEIPIVDLYQYQKVENIFTLPYYSYGLYYQKIIDIEEASDISSIYELEVQIQTTESEVFDVFEVRSPKYLTKSTEKVVFIKYLSKSKIQIEFGSGIHGLHVPGATIKLIFKLTDGSRGNILTTTSTPIDGTVKVFEMSNNTITDLYNVSPEDVITVNIEYGEGGSDLLVQDELREDVIRYVQTRNNLISEPDFYNFLQQHFENFFLMFKKTHFNDNIIYLFLIFKDKYQLPTISKSISLFHNVFNPSSSNFIFKPSFTIDSKEYISPFIYIYDSLLRAYFGYIYQEQLSINFTDIIYQEEEEEQVKLLPSINLSFELQPHNNRTLISVQSYQDISMYRMFLTIEELGIFDECMDDLTDNKKGYFYIDNSTKGVILDCFKVVIRIEKDAVHLYTATLIKVCLSYDASDILKLVSYEDNSNITTSISPDSYIVHIPVMLLEDYDNNINYYDQKLLATLGKVINDGNRMISDDLQIRFLNTEIVPSEYLKIITLQGHDFNLTLPLKLKVSISVNQDYITTNNIDTSTSIEQLKLDLATKLYEKYSGLEISFYYTQIVDIIHTLPWVRNCEVRVFDSSDPIIEIPNGNFEVISQREVVDMFTNKVDVVKYCPIYFYWDLDNIDIDMFL